MIAAPLKHFGHDLFLADVRLVNVLNRNPRRRRQLLSATPDRIAQRLGKARVERRLTNPLSANLTTSNQRPSQRQ